jgi:ABC-2 type transport system ATP-binding protein
MLEGMGVIEARGLRKTYRGLFGRGGREALRGLDLEIGRGVAFGLIGLNGAGKTTFIKTLLGVVRPSAGQVRVLGKDPQDPAARAGIGYLPERLFLPHAFTPVQFLESVARLKGLRRAGDEVRRQIARVGLAGEEGRRIGGFSKGMRQRLGLAAALLGEPTMLLGEERARGATLFLNSHLLSETERVCDRIGILSGGRLLREGPLEALCGSETRHRLRFAPGFDPTALAALGLAPGEGEGVFMADAADPAQLNRLIDAARAAGALLVELRRDTRDLEEVLSEALGGDGTISRGEAT